MALFDDALKGGNILTGLAIGAVALIVWPMARPLAKAAMKGGILAYREATRLYDGTIRGIGDLATEALEEIGSEVAKEGIEEAGAELAKEGVKEVGTDLAAEAL
jgi:hypothetical protein